MNATTTLDARTFSSPVDTHRGPLQITMSPYYGRPDFSGVSRSDAPARNIDMVSVADILRNAFVYPPHSIFEDIKLVTFGFSPSQDMQASPEFHFKFRDSGKRADTEGHPRRQTAVDVHRLRDPVTGSGKENNARHVGGQHGLSYGSRARENKQ